MKDIRGHGTVRQNSARIREPGEPGPARRIEAAGKPPSAEGQGSAGDFEFGAYWTVLDTAVEIELSVPVLV